MAVMIIPGSADFQIWYADNPADTADDGLSNVQWINTLSTGTGYGYSFPETLSMDWVDNAFWYGLVRYRNDNYQNSWYYANYVPSTWPNGARHNVDDYPNQYYIAEFWNYNTLEGDGSGWGYYVDYDESEPFVNYEGMTTYIQWIPEYDPFAYGEYYNWDPEALAWDPGSTFPSPK